jgi:hypothetical protein|tara:strand:- start:133 stop:324 length:192 start_codon:yes stop_codon:yes gene_type:complete
MDNIQFMKLFLKLGTFADYNDKQALEFQERIVFATQGIIKPDNWEQLSFEEKKKRMNNLLKEI